MTRIKNNGQVNRQRFSIAEMEDFGDQFNDYQNLNLEDICGCWHSWKINSYLPHSVHFKVIP